MDFEFGRLKQRALELIFPGAQLTNDVASKSSIWCLGQEHIRSPPPPPAEARPRPPSFNNTQPSPPESTASHSIPSNGPATPPDSTASSSFDSGLAYDEARNSEDDYGWPPSFLDDFEARIWLTYRSGFPAIPRSQDPAAASAISLKVRFSSWADQGGFTSDTGWGCMIRSGQSLLANSLVMLRLGRGMRSSCPVYSGF